MTSLTVDQMAVNTQKHSLEQEVNAYLLTTASGNALLIDAGYEDTTTFIYEFTKHREATIQGIYLTHYHPDHSLGAPELAQKFNCPIHCHPLEYPRLTSLYEQHGIPVQNLDIRADLIPTSKIILEDHTLDIVFTPGHTHGHIALYDSLTQVLFTGDTVIPGGTVWIGPPDGHLADYLQSLDALCAFSPKLVYPGHGAVTHDPVPLMLRMKERRLLREQQILHFIKQTPQSIEQITKELYRGSIREDMLWVAKKTVQGHLQKLIDERQVTLSYDSLTFNALYRANERPEV
ncbi:MBL fold metallo-hydrolase [Sulfoacidibacillus thermotolerans]|uniref:Metallo-beta-lactamase domain-containing protein n=1 Tax=Sulfoacidibacillus thermotolerans TaxID=1765684 RepID=A0A2U3DCB6_SULT2|nr:MBL fold metallo-hydrolase [Sulfoacidibacillus thermotolerans]PWI58916.1 hypothetical protein BM613_02200 [Sulfoacidibacillus thermotolerans]